MTCSRCGSRMILVDIYGPSEKISSWVCYKCGECIDEVILINRGVMTAESKPAELGQG